VIGLGVCLGNEGIDIVECRQAAGLARAPDSFALLALTRSPDAVWVEPAEWHLLKTLAPHLQRAAAVHILLAQTRATTESLGAAIAAAGFASRWRKRAHTARFSPSARRTRTDRNRRRSDVCHGTATSRRAIHRTWLGCWSPERGVAMLMECRLFMSPIVCPTTSLKTLAAFTGQQTWCATLGYAWAGHRRMSAPK
jgi:hypothetical protein